MDPNTLKILQGAAGAGDSTIGVEDVFKTYLWKGTGNSTTITNDIDLSGEGGLTWIKNRSINCDHMLYDTERGVTKALSSNDDGDEATETGGITAFNSNGFTVGGNGESNQWNASMCSWTFRKTKKFFDIVTWSKSGSNGTAPRVLNHNLGSTPGFIMLKQIDSSSEGWICWHRDFGSSNNANYIRLNTNTSMGTDGSSPPNASVNSVDSTTFTVGKDNDRVGSYIAYLFAHEEAAFGPNSDQKIISCGSYSGNSSSTNISLDFEPQWIMIKCKSFNESWFIFDSMRGIVTGHNDEYLEANTTGDWENADYIDLTSTGFTAKGSSYAVNKNGEDYIFIAIAAETGKTMKAIETPSDVFAMDTGNASTTIPSMDSGFPVDFGIIKTVGASTSWNASARLMHEQFLKTDDSDAEDSSTGYPFDSNVGWGAADWLDSDRQSWMWKRHAGFDVVCYVGNGNNTDGANSHAHSLGQEPQMIWIKTRSGGTYSGVTNWTVGHKDLNGGTNAWQKTLILNDDDYERSTDNFGNTAPTSSVFYVGEDSNGRSNTNGANFIALLFSSVDGISKCGGYDGDTNAEDKTISCGFAPRFVLAKIRNLSGGYHHWFVFDSTRGAGSGNDKTLRLDVNEAQTTNQDIIEFTSDGFIVKAGYQLNEGSRSYIYYAHA